MKTVSVLMSTYNGSKYILEQINSILSQKEVNIRLIVRDDGSKDNTVSLINAINDERITLVKGENAGYINSFIELLNIAGDSDYYAFSDQDDIWDNDKIITACMALEPYENTPAIYSSNTRLVDKDGKFLTNESRKVKTNIYSAIIKNYVTGCTTVFNKELWLMVKGIYPKNPISHDWWLNVVCLALGGVSIFDETPHISYRQHGNNVIGATSGGIKKYIFWTKKFFNKEYHRDFLCREILDQFKGKIPENNKKILLDMGYYRNKKISVLLNSKWNTKGIIENIGFKLIVLFDKA